MTLVLFHSSIDNRVDLFHWTAVTVAVSVIAHSSTDVLIAKWMKRHNEAITARARGPDGV
jgi:NhaP-type Na+/H+ or K+/H+ antiporter